MDIIALTTSLHTVIAVSDPSSGVSTIDLISWIGIPLFLAFVTAVVGIVRGSIKFAQYMAHSSESADSIAKTSDDLSKAMTSFVERTDAHLSLHDQEIAVIKYAIGPNGNPFKTARLIEETESADHLEARDVNEEVKEGGDK
jgi:hypothetical protein